MTTLTDTMSSPSGKEEVVAWRRAILGAGGGKRDRLMTTIEAVAGTATPRRPMTTPDEPSLIDRFRNGDEEALRALFDACAPILRERLMRGFGPALRRKLSVADLLQEARLAAWEARDRFEDRGPDAFRNWLFGIVDHRLQRAREHHGAQMRRLDREVSRPHRADTVEFRGAAPSPSQWAIAAEARQRLLAGIEALPEPYRQVIRLTHGEQLDLRAVAARVGRSYAATKKLHARALLRLRGVLRPDAGGHDG